MRSLPRAPILSLKAPERLASISELQAANRTPLQEYERTWALTVLARAVAKLRSEHRRIDKLALFEVLAGSMTGQASESSSEVAARLDMTDAAVRKAKQRMKQRFGKLLRDEIAALVADPADIEDELRIFLSALKN